MGKKIVAFVVILGAVSILAYKQYVYNNILGTELDSSRFFNGGVFALLFAILIAAALLIQRRPRSDFKSKNTSDSQPRVTAFFTVQFAIGAFLFYLILLLMRLFLFIDMYTESPIMLMVEFTLVTIVALMLFVPFLVDRIGNENKADENQ